MTANSDKTVLPPRSSTPDVGMRDGITRVAGRLNRPRPHLAWTAAGMLAAALPAVLGLAACGSGHPGSAAASATPTGTARPAAELMISLRSNSPGSLQQQALAFAQCMRRHGVAGFPDPNSNGTFPPSSKQISLRNPHQFQEALTACRGLLPDDGNGPTPAQWQQILNTMLAFAVCMRHHGVPNWPGPTYDNHGRPVFNINVDTNSVGFNNEIRACKHLLVNYGNRPGWPDTSNYFE